MRAARSRATLLALLVLLPSARPVHAGAWWDTFVDALRGEPGSQQLERLAQFEGGGVRFAVPALLRQRHSGSDKTHEWSFARGDFELELHTAPGRFAVGDYLETLVDTLAGGRHSDAEGPLPGRTVTLCGRAVESVRARIRVLGDWTVYEGFDLPAESGQVRYLVFEDEPAHDKPSAVAQATYAAVLGSLRCQ